MAVRDDLTSALSCYKALERHNACFLNGGNHQQARSHEPGMVVSFESRALNSFHASTCHCKLQRKESKRISHYLKREDHHEHCRTSSCEMLCIENWRSIHTARLVLRFFLVPDIWPPAAECDLPDGQCNRFRPSVCRRSERGRQCREHTQIFTVHSAQLVSAGLMSKAKRAPWC
jgi:hypothetical protein